MANFNEVKQLQGKQLNVLDKISANLQIVSENQKEIIQMQVKSSTEHALEARALDRLSHDMEKLLDKAG